MQKLAVFLGLVLCGLVLGQDALVETSSSIQINLAQERGLSQNEVPLTQEEDESEFELFSRFMEMEAEAKPQQQMSKKQGTHKKSVKSNDPVAPKARKVARKLLRDLVKGLLVTFPAKFESEAANQTPGFVKTLYAKCRGLAPSPQMCNNILVVYRESYYGQNPFSKKHVGRFGASIADIIMRYVAAWRVVKGQPKGNPFAAVQKGEDPFKGIRLRPNVRGHLNRFGKINAKNELSASQLKRLGVKSDGADNTDDNGVWKADLAVKTLADRLKQDLRALRTEVVKALGRGKWAVTITHKRSRMQAAERVVAICRDLKDKADFAPTFCKSLGFLMQVNFLGKNPFAAGTIDKFAAVLAAFMQHNHRHAVRGGDIKVARRPNYAQDTVAVSVNLKLRVTPNRFNLRSLAKEFVNVLSSILRIPEQRIRVTALSLPRVRITFEFQPSRKDKAIASNENSPDSVDTLAKMFRGMARDKKSDFYKSPVLARVLPKSIVMSKMLGVGYKKAKQIRKLAASASKKPSIANKRLVNKKKSDGKHRFATAEEEEEAEATVGENTEELQAQLEEISKQELAEDSLTEEDELRNSLESDEELEDDTENPDAVPAEEDEATESASFIEALASEEENSAELTEFNVDIPYESQASFHEDEWLSLLATRSEEYITAEHEGDAQDTDEDEEADAEEEELEAEAEEEAMFEEEAEIPESAFLEEGAEMTEEAETAPAEQEEEEEEETVPTGETVLLEAETNVQSKTVEAQSVSSAAEVIAEASPASSLSVSNVALLLLMVIGLAL